MYRTPATYPKTVALTFDDGPSAFTSQILAVLRKRGVHATFFQTGLHVSAMPATSRAVVAAGNRLGNHTWSHPQAVAGSVPHGSFDELSRDVQESQIDRTTSAISTATDTTPCFFRAPGGHDAGSLTHRIAVARDLTIVNSSISSGDSAQPSRLRPAWVDRIVHNATTLPGRHPVLLMHDGKASAEPESEASSYRGNTVAALPRIIRWYKSRGYVFTDPAGRRF